MEKLYDEDEADSAKDYETGDYPKELLEAGAVMAKKGWDAVLDKLLPQARAHLKTKKVAKKEREEFENLIIAPLDKWRKKDEHYIKKLREKDIAAVAAVVDEDDDEDDDGDGGED